MLDDGVYSSISETGDAVDQTLILEQLDRSLPTDWDEQRRKILPASDDLPSPRSPSLSDRQHLVRSGMIT
jgi:hypothetical protein